MSGKHLKLFGWHLFMNCHWRHTIRTYGYRRNVNPSVRSLVVLGLELTWWRAAS